MVCPRCRKLSAQYSVPHCKGIQCGWITCKVCNRVYEPGTPADPPLRGAKGPAQ